MQLFKIKAAVSEVICMVYKNIVENKYTYHIRNNVCNGNLCSFFCVLIPVCVYCVVAAGIAVPVFVAVFSMKRATISTPAAAEYMYLSENHDVSRMVQLRVSHVWTHLQ